MSLLSSLPSFPSIHPIHLPVHPSIPHSVPCIYLFYFDIGWRSTLELRGDITGNVSDGLSEAISTVFHQGPFLEECFPSGIDKAPEPFLTQFFSLSTSLGSD